MSDAKEQLYGARIRPAVRNVPYVSYATEGKMSREVLDLGEGDNPYGFDPEILTGLSLKNPEIWAKYPHVQQKIREDVIHRWKGTADLSDEMIHLSAGSIDAITTVFSLLDPRSGAVLGVILQFSEAITAARAAGFTYQGIPLQKEQRYRIPVDALVDAMSDSICVLHLENPHNPTGQTLNTQDLRRLLERARETGSYVLVDEAFGDYVDPVHSAVPLLSSYDNLLITRTFSKGWGFAGARAGYLLLPETLFHQAQKLSNPYRIPGPVGEVLHALLQSDAHLQNSRVRIRGTKKRLMQQMKGPLTAACTHPDVPILLVCATDPAVLLAPVFLSEKIRVIGGENYHGLDPSCARLRVPAETEEARLLDALARIQKKL